MSASTGPAVLLAFRLFKLYFAPRPLSEVTSLSLSQLKAKYKRVDLLGNVLGIVVFLVLGAAMAGAARGVQILTNRHPDAKFVDGQGWFMTIVLGFLLAVAWSMPVLLTFIKIVVRGQYEEYLAYGSHLFGWDWRKVIRRVLVPLASVATVFCCLAICMHTTFTDSGMYHAGYWSFGVEKFRSYSDIKGIYNVAGYTNRQTGKFGAQPLRYIVFTDGSREQFTPIADPCVDFAAEKSGRPIVDVRTRDDIPK